MIEQLCANYSVNDLSRVVHRRRGVVATGDNCPGEEVDNVLTMDDCGAIRRARRDVKSVRQIAREFHHSRNTVRKNLNQPVLSRALSARTRSASVIGPFQPAIDQVLRDDEDTPLKQRHTAMQVFRRLQLEHGYRGCYGQVRRYVLKHRLRDQHVFTRSGGHPGRFANGQAMTSKQRNKHYGPDEGILREGSIRTDWSSRMANLLNMPMTNALHSLHRRGWSQRRIAGELGINRETVARHLRQGDPRSKPPYAPPSSTTADDASSPAHSLADPHEPRNHDATRCTDNEWMLAVLQGKVLLDSIQRTGPDADYFDKLVTNLRNGNLKVRNKSLCIIAKLNAIPILSISQFLHVSRSTIKTYWKTFRVFGYERLLDGFYGRHLKAHDVSLCDSLFSILHTPPSAFDLNRTTWKIADLRRILQERKAIESRHRLSD